MSSHNLFLCLVKSNFHSSLSQIQENLQASRYRQNVTINRMKTFRAYGLEDVDPRGFVSLMDMYENNYIRFKKLAGDIQSMESHAVSRIFGCLDLYLTVIERCKYTTTVTLTYAFEDETDLVFEPDLKLRICHDAKLVEVIAGHLTHGKQRLDHVPANVLKLKWKINRFLYKWLGYCLYLGHQFEASTASKSSTLLMAKPSPLLVF